MHALQRVEELQQQRLVAGAQRGEAPPYIHAGTASAPVEFLPNHCRGEALQSGKRFRAGENCARVPRSSGCDRRCGNTPITDTGVRSRKKPVARSRFDARPMPTSSCLCVAFVVLTATGGALTAAQQRQRRRPTRLAVRWQGRSVVYPERRGDGRQGADVSAGRIERRAADMLAAGRHDQLVFRAIGQMADEAVEYHHPDRFDGYQCLLHDFLAVSAECDHRSPVWRGAARRCAGRRVQRLPGGAALRRDGADAWRVDRQGRRSRLSLGDCLGESGSSGSAPSSSSRACRFASSRRRESHSA